jgi:gliding motility-associated lipoprotein GldB
MERKRLFLIIVFLFAVAGYNSCDVKGGATASNPVPISRFDKDLYRLMETDTPELQQQMAENYAPLLKLIGMSLFRTKDTQSTAFFDRLLNYYSEPALNQLYQDVLKRYENMETIENELGNSFQYLHAQFPDRKIPAVYMHISGLKENVIVGDSLLSLSIDKYMGAGYPLYQKYFYDYQLRKMEPDYIVPDYLTAWLLSEYPFKGDERVLLERMIYEGKIKYILHKAYPRLIPEMCMGYTPADWQWCKQNEKMLWNLIIERKHLYTPDVVTTANYFSGKPSAFISADAPGNLGVWTGWQIVTKYMEKTRDSIEQLMNNNDWQDILRKSKYKP